MNHIVQIWQPNLEVLASVKYPAKDETPKIEKSREQKKGVYLGKISNRIAEHQESLYIYQLADKLQHGYALVLGDLSTPDPSGKHAGKIHRANACVTSKSLFGLDFDNDKEFISLEDALKRAASIGGCCISYDTIGSNRFVAGTRNKHRFRMIFQTAEVQTPEQAAIIQKQLLKLFPESDKACKDICRVFFGTTKNRRLEYDEDKVLNLVNLNIQVAAIVNAEDPANASHNRKSLSVKAPKKVAKTSGSNTTFSADEKLQVINWNLATDLCRLANEYVSGNYIGHQEAMLLGSFAHVCRGGHAWYKKYVVSGAGGDREKASLRLAQAKANADAGHHTWGCESYCPYYDQCQNPGKTIFSQITLKPGDVRKTAESAEGLTLAQAERKLSDVMTKAYNSEDHISIIKADTGLGKTEQYCKLAQPGDIICSPTHNLDKEVATTLAKYGKKCVIATARPVLPDKKQQEYIDQLRAIGNDSAAANDWKQKVDYYESQNQPETRTSGWIKCIEWRDQQEVLKTTTDIIVCTHAKLLHISNPNINRIFVDEDPLTTMLTDNHEITKYAVEKLIEILEKDNRNLTSAWSGKVVASQSSATKAFQFLAELETLTVNGQILIPTTIFSKPELKEIRTLIDSHKNAFQSKIIKLFSAQKILYWHNDKEQQCKYICINNNAEKLNKGLKYIIMSATIDSEMFSKYIFHETVKTYEINLEDKGMIKLHTALPTSRAHIDNNTMKYIETKCGTDKNLITFKNFTKAFADYGFQKVAMKIYLLNTEGYNGLGGEDLIVAGTPYADRIQYLKLAVALGINFTPDDIQQHNIRITRNGYCFYVMTFANPELQAIQLHMMDTELIQAVGRARAIRNKLVFVHIFSQYPIPGVKIFADKEYADKPKKQTKVDKFLERIDTLNGDD